MAVVFGAAESALAPATSQNYNTSTLAISGSNLVLLVAIALNSTTATVSSLSWSLGSGTAVEIKTVRQVASFVSIWAIPNPTAGSGHAVVGLSASVPHQTDVVYFTGVDQTTPCPAADAASTTVSGSNTTLSVTPANLTANDASYGIGCNTVNDDVSSFSPNQTYLDDTSTVNAESGYRIGTGAVTANWTTTGSANLALVGVRIVAAAAGGGTVVFRRRALMGVGV